MSKMNESPREQRTLQGAELRVDADGAKPVIRGYAAVFNTLSENLGDFREQIAAGAFADALQASDVRALINHDANLVLGRNKAGTLVMREDVRGLYIEVTPPDTQAARDLQTLIQRGDVNQMSFAFTVRKEDQTWQRDGQGPWIRTIKRVDRLYDVSVVTYPAYADTSAAMRALNDLQTAERELQEAKRRERVARERAGREIDLLTLRIKR